MTSNIQTYSSYDEKRFSEDVIVKWGDANHCLMEDANLLHVQMAHLGRIAAESFKDGDGSAGMGILEFLDGVLARSDAISEIENATAISFLTSSEFGRLGIVGRLPSRVLNVAVKQQAQTGNAT